MINKIFAKQIGRNVEAYVDDILIKSEKYDQHVKDLYKVFGVSRKFIVKPNLTKCVFGVVVRKFLAFMVSQRGIKANPKEIKAILDMQPPSIGKVV